jgi:hypothetical protein
MNAYACLTISKSKNIIKPQEHHNNNNKKIKELPAYASPRPQNPPG